MLIEAAAEVKQTGGSVQRMRFYGQEVNQTSAAIGRMNLFIHEVEDAQIRREDTLQKPKFIDAKGKLDQFDLVLANPPHTDDSKEWRKISMQDFIDSDREPWNPKLYDNWERLIVDEEWKSHYDFFKHLKKLPTFQNLKIFFLIHSSSIKPHRGIIRLKISKANS